MSISLSELFARSAANVLMAGTPEYVAQLEAAIELIISAFRSGHKLLVFGNGGSAADAQHIAGELAGRFHLNRAGLPAAALGSNAALTTAWSNDHEFSSVFARELQALGREGDVAWAISTSGNSPNVVEACRYARGAGIKVIALTGEGGGQLAGLADVLLAAPCTDTPRVQEVHLVSYHAICAAVEERMFQ